MIVYERFYQRLIHWKPPPGFTGRRQEFVVSPKAT
jgi:hypothetical protein